MKRLSLSVLRTFALLCMLFTFSPTSVRAGDIETPPQRNGDIETPPVAAPTDTNTLTAVELLGIIARGLFGLV